MMNFSHHLKHKVFYLLTVSKFYHHRELASWFTRKPTKSRNLVFVEDSVLQEKNFPAKPAQDEKSEGMSEINDEQIIQ